MTNLTTSPLRSSWRKRAARNFRTFRRVRGYWPDKQLREAVKRGIDQAVAQGLKPTVEH